jgi:hypothetical protein
MLRELPRTSKKTSPSRGSGAASDADMLPMVARSLPFVHLVANIARQARHRFENARNEAGNQAVNFVTSRARRRPRMASLSAGMQRHAWRLTGRVNRRAGASRSVL